MPTHPDSPQVHGAKAWSKIAKDLGTKGSKQCRRRWKNFLNMNAKTCGWSAEEDEQLIEAHRRCGNKWTEISRMFGDRCGRRSGTRGGRDVVLGLLSARVSKKAGVGTSHWVVGEGCLGNVSRAQVSQMSRLSTACKLGVQHHCSLAANAGQEEPGRRPRLGALLPMLLPRDLAHSPDCEEGVLWSTRGLPALAQNR